VKGAAALRWELDPMIEAVLPTCCNGASTTNSAPGPAQRTLIKRADFGRQSQEKSATPRGLGISCGRDHDRSGAWSVGARSGKADFTCPRLLNYVPTRRLQVPRAALQQPQPREPPPPRRHHQPPHPPRQGAHVAGLGHYKPALPPPQRPRRHDAHGGTCGRAAHFALVLPSRWLAGSQEGREGSEGYPV
jgi:hypothetical protein